MSAPCIVVSRLTSTLAALLRISFLSVVFHHCYRPILLLFPLIAASSDSDLRQLFIWQQ